MSEEKEKKIRRFSIDKLMGKKKDVKVDKDKLKAFMEKMKAKTAPKPEVKEKKKEIMEESETKNIKISNSKQTTKEVKKEKTVLKTAKEYNLETEDETQKKQSVKKEKILQQLTKEEKVITPTPTPNFVEIEIKQDDKKKKSPKAIKIKDEKPKQEMQKETPKEEKKQEEKIIATKKEGVEYKKIKVSTALTVRDLAEKLGIKSVELIKKLMGMGIFASITQKLEEDVAALVSLDYGYELEFIPQFEDVAIKEEEERDDPSKLKTRAPIITIMGHVDHGKTTLLDALRESNIVDSEAGQITQHIGAYMVRTQKGNITVIDTPGHEAFTAMRSQGVKITDIVVLVVCAKDGVMPQTVEAINHAKAANVPIIVAINKIDLPQANPNMVKQQLASYNLIPEEWGGKVPVVEISARNKLNIDKLLDIILLQAEIMELKANYETTGSAVIIEAKKDAKKGIVATLICNRGKITIGDNFVVGTTYGKVKALIDDRGLRLNEILPSMPAEILGINDEIPVPGDVLKVVESERKAKEIAQARKQIRKDNILHQKNISLLSLKDQIEKDRIKDLNIIIKADVYGSLQAIRDTIEKYTNSEVAIHILHTGIGNITESDVELAKASNAIIFGFNVRTPDEVSEKAKMLNVEIRIYKIIYELFEDIKAAMNGMLEPEIVEVEVGRATIKQIFNISSGKIAGSVVIEGKIQRNAFVKIMRNNEIIGQGKISGLKRFKEDIREVEKGYECGIMIEGFKDFEEGDSIVAVVKEERIRRINEFQR